MNKRRRAYKKYDWQKHSISLIDRQLNEALGNAIGRFIDLATLYGTDQIEFRNETVTLKAGLWKFEPVIKMPYLKGH